MNKLRFKTFAVLAVMMATVTKTTRSQTRTKDSITSCFFNI